jgi:hypothetical protein
MHSVHDRLVKRHPQLAGVPFHSAVCFPFIAFTDESEEWRTWQVIDKLRLQQRPLAECIVSVLKQMGEHLEQTRPAWFDPRAGEPTTEQCDAIVSDLRPDFEFYESPKARARRIDEEIRHYTEEQFAALDHMRAMSRVVFDGQAGTGKTLLALEAARRSHAAGRSVLLLCFNRPLMEWLSDQTLELFDPLQAPTIVALTLHEYMRSVAGDSVQGSPDDGSPYWRQSLPDAAVLRLLEDAETLQRYEQDHPHDHRHAPSFHIFDELIIDEAQDILYDVYLDVLEVSLRGGLTHGTWRMFGDFSQQRLYDDSVSLEQFCGGRGAGCGRYTLDENCRNSPRVAAWVTRACGLDDGYRRVLRADDGVEPIVCFYRDEDDQRQQLVRVLAELYEAGFTGPQTAVLSSHSDDKCIARLVADQRWRDRLEPLRNDKDLRVNLRDGKTHYSSIHRFKGLEARAVVLTDIEQLDTPRDRALLYVGATRATQRLVVLAHEGLRPALR